MDNKVKTAVFKFSDDFDPLLTSERREKAFEYSFKGRQTVKHLIESLGVPHTEIGCIYSNGSPVGFKYLVANGDRINVTGTETDDQTKIDLDGDIRFILDAHLGKLASHLRFLGFDSLYRNDYDDETLAILSSQRNRILLTRDRGLLMRRVILYGYWVRSKKPKEQLIEVVGRYDLKKYWMPFKRCVRCNDLLVPVAKDEILHRLQSLTKRYFNDFRKCRGCNQIYWRGSHFEKMQAFISEI